MDITKAFTFVFDDENWKTKIGIGALISLGSSLIIPIPLLVGYLVAVMRNVADGEEHPLPEWDDWETLFRDGLALIGAQLVYMSPLLILGCVATVSTVSFGALLEASEDVAAAGLFATFGLLFCIGGFFVLVMAFVRPAIYVQYVRHNSFGACLRFGEVFGIVRDNVMDIVLIALAVVGAILLLIVLTMTLSIIPCLGQIVAMVLGVVLAPYLSVVAGHLYGQLANKGMASKFS